MLSRILVPMDTSEHAEQALKFTLENHPDADITVLHVVGVPSMMMGDAAGLSLEDDIAEAAERRAEPVFDRAREIAANHDQEISTTVGVGHPVRNILERAGEYDAVVLGAHGSDRKRATHRFLVGNIAETVSKQSPVPVVIVR